MNGLSFQRIFSHVVLFCIRVGIFYRDWMAPFESHSPTSLFKEVFQEHATQDCVQTAVESLCLEGDSATSWAACSNVTCKV